MVGITALGGRPRPRRRAAWTPYLDRARGGVADAAAATRGRRHVIVLGSGLLDDVSFDGLARRCGHVSLVDAVHPRPTRIAAHHHVNVTLVTADLGAGPDGVPAALLAQADLIVSANLLSQLTVVPIETCEARRCDAPSLLGATLIAGHLAFRDALAKRAERVCLITDTLQRAVDRAGRTTDSLDLMFGVRLPPPTQSWDWEIAPFGEASRRHRLVHRVQAYPDWAAARLHGERSGSIVPGPGVAHAASRSRSDLEPCPTATARPET